MTHDTVNLRWAWVSSSSSRVRGKSRKMQKWPRRPTAGIELVLEWVAKGRTEEFEVSRGPNRPREGE